MKVIYSGVHLEVEVLDADVIAKRDVPVDIDDAVASRLLEQDAWSEHKPETDAQRKAREAAEKQQAEQDAAAQKAADEARAKVAAEQAKRQAGGN